MIFHKLSTIIVEFGAFITNKIKRSKKYRNCLRNNIQITCEIQVFDKHFKLIFGNLYYSKTYHKIMLLLSKYS